MGENDEKIIYQDYINCYDCWVRASFIPAAWDAEGNLTHVMLTDEGARVETAANGKLWTHSPTAPRNITM